MGMMIGSAGFSGYRKKTQPLTAVPKNVRETIPIRSISESGIFQIGQPEGRKQLFDRVYLMDDINYTLKDDREKEAVLLTLCKIFNSINVDFKFVTANTKRDLEQFYKDIFYDEETGNASLSSGMNAWIREGLKKGNPEICRLRYLVLTVRKNTYEEAKTFFIGMDALLAPLFGSIKSNLRPLDAAERLRLLYSAYRQRNGSKFRWNWEEMLRTKRDWKNEILPSSIESRKDHMEMDGKYVSVLFSFRLPNGLDESKVMSELSNLPFPSMVTLDFAPIPRSALRGKLMASLSNNERATHMEQERRMRMKNFVSGVSYKKQKRRDELEGYLEQIDDNDENGFFFSLLLVLTADTEEELQSRREAVQSVGESLGIELVPYLHRQLKALNTALPTGAREVDCMRSMLTSSLAAFQPFYSKDIIHTSGQVMGINRVTQNLIMLDRKKLKNGNGVISGHTGGGKSMYLKAVEITQTMIGSDDDIFCIDPQNELKSLTETLCGQFFDLSAQSKIYLNFLEIPDEVRYSHDPGVRDVFVAEQISFTEAFCYSIMKGICETGIHKSIITGCVMKIYEAAFQDSRCRQPLLNDFYQALLAYEQENPRDGQEVREIYKPLEAYCIGNFDMFAHPSNLDIRNRFVVFGMKNISREMWEPIMLVVMHVLAQRINYNQKFRRATHFIVDEGQVVCSHENSAEQLSRAFLTYRKFGGICTLVVQNMAAALANATIKNLVSNCEFKMFFDQGGVDRQEIAEIIELSSEEYAALNEDIPGRSVIVWGKDVLLCDGRISEDNPLYGWYHTTFHESKEKI